MTRLDTKSISEALVTRLRQVAPIDTAWGPSSSFSAIGVIQVGALDYWTIDRLSRYLPICLVRAVQASVEPDDLDQSPDAVLRLTFRVVYARSYKVDGGDPELEKQEEVDALADAFADDAILNNIALGEMTLYHSFVSAVMYQAEEEDAIAAAGKEDIFAAAFEVTVTAMRES